MKGRLKYAFCNSNPESGDVKIVAIDEHGNVHEGTIASTPLLNWLATNGNLTQVAIGGTGTEETQRARVG